MDLSPTENAPPEWSEQKLPQTAAREATTDDAFVEHLRGTDGDDEQYSKESIGLGSPVSMPEDVRESEDQQNVEGSESPAKNQEDRLVAEGVVALPTTNRVPLMDGGLMETATEVPTESQSEPLVDTSRERQSTSDAIELEPGSTETVESAVVDFETVELVKPAAETSAKDGMDLGQDSLKVNVNDTDVAAQNAQKVGNDAELQSAGDQEISPPTVAPIETDTPIANGAGPSTDSVHGNPAAKEPTQVADQGAVSPPSSTQKERLEVKNSSSADGHLPSDPLRTTSPTSYQANASSTIIEAVDGIAGAPLATAMNEEIYSSTQNTAGDHSATPATTPADRLSNHLFSRAAVPTDGQTELSQSDQARFIKRVAQAIQAAPQRGGVLRIRLHPPELGAMSLEVVTRRGTVTARIETESHVARTLLLDNLPELKERLEQQGVRIERFDVDVSKREPGNEFQQPHDAQRQSASSRTGKSVHDDDSEESANAGIPQALRRIDSVDGSINIVI